MDFSRETGRRAALNLFVSAWLRARLAPISLVNCITLNEIPIPFLIFMQSSSAKLTVPKNFDIQGHRGCRGLFPENTLPAFVHALELGVTTLELDVVISGDLEVVVSHEPWMSAEICLAPDGQELEGNTPTRHLIYQMNQAQIRNFDCGSKKHPDFPRQVNTPTPKPLLREVIELAEGLSRRLKRPLPFYNIETKCTPEGDGLLHPEPAEFCRLLLEVISHYRIKDRVILQSFDVRTLQIFREQGHAALSLLVENSLSPAENIELLGFDPAIYSPDFQLVNPSLISFCRQRKMKVIPWTVNEPAEMKKLIEYGVDGLITDYPDLISIEN